jgi:hypothetical protein
MILSIEASNTFLKITSRSGLYPASSCIKLSGQAGKNQKKPNKI